jgi:hypothetical protein
VGKWEGEEGQIEGGPADLVLVSQHSLSPPESSQKPSLVPVHMYMYLNLCQYQYMYQVPVPVPTCTVQYMNE